jgi:hypothetical protein
MLLILCSIIANYSILFLFPKVSISMGGFPEVLLREEEIVNAINTS